MLINSLHDSTDSPHHFFFYLKTEMKPFYYAGHESYLKYQSHWRINNEVVHTSSRSHNNNKNNKTWEREKKTTSETYLYEQTHVKEKILSILYNLVRGRFVSFDLFYFIG